MLVINAPKTHEINKEIKIHSLRPCGNCSLLVIHTMPYANGTRIRIVLTMEIHIGVIVSPAPRITPDRHCVTAMAM